MRPYFASVNYFVFYTLSQASKSHIPQPGTYNHSLSLKAILTITCIECLEF